MIGKNGLLPGHSFKREVSNSSCNVVDHEKVVISSAISTGLCRWMRWARSLECYGGKRSYKLILLELGFNFYAEFSMKKSD